MFGLWGFLGCVGLDSDFSGFSRGVFRSLLHPSQHSCLGTPVSLRFVGTRRASLDGKACLRQSGTRFARGFERPEAGRFSSPK